MLGMTAGLIDTVNFISEPLICLLVGILIGPAALNLLDLSSLGDQELILEQAALITLGIALMGVALRLPPAYSRSIWRSLTVLLALLMPLMWLGGSLLVYLIVGLPFWVAALIGAILTPTDPVVSSIVVAEVVAEEHLPERLRHTISAESAFNDGLAYPFVVLPILLLAYPPGEALAQWLISTILWEVGAGIALGALISYGAAKILKWIEKKKPIATEHASFLTISLALALTVVGVLELIGLNSVLAAFVAGLIFNAVASNEAREQQEHVQDAITRFFDLPIFVLLGMTLPWQGWFELGWSGLLLAVAVLFLRRLPALLLLRPLLAEVGARRDALFLGWFGPIGAAALYYATFSIQKGVTEEVWIISSLVICASVVVHGLTATPLTKLYGKYAANE